MVYHSIAEIFDLIEKSQARFIARVADLSEAQEQYRPEAGGWTIAEIVEHVSIVDDQLLRLTHKLLKQAEASGAQASADGRIGPISLKQAEERQGEKFKAPEQAEPRGGARVAESLAKIRQSLDGLCALRPRLEAADLSQVSFPHLAFGPLNLYEWLVLIGVHQDRHRGQIEAVMSAPGFPA
jgi:uncharacterized damage-inducible protein DinB